MNLMLGGRFGNYCLQIPAISIQRSRSQEKTHSETTITAPLNGGTVSLEFHMSRESSRNSVTAVMSARQGVEATDEGLPHPKEIRQRNRSGNTEQNSSSSSMNQPSKENSQNRALYGRISSRTGGFEGAAPIRFDHDDAHGDNDADTVHMSNTFKSTPEFRTTDRIRNSHKGINSNRKLQRQASVPSPNEATACPTRRGKGTGVSGLIKRWTVMSTLAEKPGTHTTKGQKMYAKELPWYVNSNHTMNSSTTSTGGPRQQLQTKKSKVSTRTIATAPISLHSNERNQQQSTSKSKNNPPGPRLRLPDDPSLHVRRPTTETDHTSAAVVAHHVNHRQFAEWTGDYSKNGNSEGFEVYSIVGAKKVLPLTEQGLKKLESRQDEQFPKSRPISELKRSLPGLLLGRRKEEGLADFSLAPLNAMDHLQTTAAELDPKSALSSDKPDRSCILLSGLFKKPSGRKKKVEAAAVAHLERERLAAMESKTHKIFQERQERDRIERRRRAYLQEQRSLEMGPQNLSIQQRDSIFETMSWDDENKESNSNNAAPVNVSLATTAAKTNTVRARNLPPNRLETVTANVPPILPKKPDAEPPTSAPLPPCVVCNEGKREYIATPCMHFAFCQVCAMRLKRRRKPCPVCFEEDVVYAAVTL
jgi:Zinc finger, C3HC4 type (RING finger)